MAADVGNLISGSSAFSRTSLDHHNDLGKILKEMGIPADVGEKAMAPQSSTLAWKIPWMKESGRLQSMGLQRVGHD